MRASWSVLAVVSLGVGAVAACGPRGGAPLAAAGTTGDDGVGGLARGSTRLLFAGVGDDDDAAAGVADERYQRTYDHDPLAYAGYGYGGFGYGGFGYGGFGYGGMAIGFGAPRGRAEPPVYDARSGGGLGAVEGTLAWQADAGVAWPVGCPLARTARARAPVAGAVVYLDRITHGRALGGRTGGVLTATGCGLEPAVQVVGPLPAGLVIDNAAPDLARLAVTMGARDQLELDPGGRIELPVDRPGVMAIEALGGAPAWVIGQAHPYYTVTDEVGRFALDLVPAGTHTLVIWSPPLVAAVTVDGPQWSPPTIERRTIVVPAGGLATVQLAVTPAGTAATADR